MIPTLGQYAELIAVLSDEGKAEVPLKYRAIYADAIHRNTLRKIVRDMMQVGDGVDNET